MNVHKTFAYLVIALCKIETTYQTLFAKVFYTEVLTTSFRSQALTATCFFFRRPKVLNRKQNLDIVLRRNSEGNQAIPEHKTILL